MCVRVLVYGTCVCVCACVLYVCAYCTCVCTVRVCVLYVLVKAPLRVLYVIYCTRGAVERPIHARGEAECCIGIETVPQVQ